MPARAVSVSGNLNTDAPPSSVTTRRVSGLTPNFSIAGPYTEWLVLGAAAIHYDGKLIWNNAKGEFTNNKDASKWIKPAYRKGWDVKL